MDGAEELERFVKIATALNDGEAMALAIVCHRGWRLATDDRKAARIADSFGVQVGATSELVRQWAVLV
jgi:predicted nucleic acid-binding protein